MRFRHYDLIINGSEPYLHEIEIGRGDLTALLNEFPAAIKKDFYRAAQDLLSIKDSLSEAGTVYIRIDREYRKFSVRLLDMIFGSKNFRGSVKCWDSTSILRYGPAFRAEPVEPYFYQPNALMPAYAAEALIGFHNV